MSTELSKSQVLEGDILTDDSKDFGVTYIRYGDEYTEWCNSIESCIDFLYWQSDANQLTYCESIIKDRQDTVLRTNAEIDKLIENYEDKRYGR